MSTASMMSRLAKVNTLPPDVDGMGYATGRIQGGAGFSYVRYASKKMDSGAWVYLAEKVPSPFDIGSKGISSSYSVYLGMSDKGEDLNCPFMFPASSNCFGFAPDSEVNWYAVFGEDAQAAEAFALQIEMPGEGSCDFGGNLAIVESQLSDYFRPAAQGGLLEKAHVKLLEQDRMRRSEIPKMR